MVLQFGVRYDHINVDASADAAFGPARSRTFNDLSGSLGLVYAPVEAYALAFSAAYSQRAPTYQELFADGPHVATGAFEIGDATLPVEHSIAFDLSLRKKTGRVTGSVSAFYTRFSDFIGQFATGAIEVAYGYDRFGARIETQFVARQGRTADFELPTDAYYLLNASLTYRLNTGPVEWDVFVKGTNLTNQKARLSTSFLKDIAPLGGRGVVIGMNANF